jgi:hypothetical protein
MHVLLVANVLVVELVAGNPLLSMRRAQQRNEIALEVGAELVDKLPRVLANDLHLPDVRLGLDVALEAVGVATLLLADFTPPPQPLQTLRLHLIGDPFVASHFSFAHVFNFAPRRLSSFSVLVRISLKRDRLDSSAVLDLCGRRMCDGRELGVNVESRWDFVGLS